MNRILRGLIVLLALACVAGACLATDLTLYVVSDTHFTGKDLPKNDKVCIQAMNGLSGAAYPIAVGGNVGQASAVITCGDLCDGGFNTKDKGSGRTYESQWKGYDYYFTRDGVLGNSIRLVMPNLAVAGNHDIYRTYGSPQFGGRTSYVVNKLKERYGLLWDVAYTGNVYYSTDIDGVHLVSLGVWPDAGVLARLRSDLNSLDADTPVVLFSHYGVDGQGSSSRQALADVIEGHNVIAMLHGHTHKSRHYVWNGIDIYDDGTAGYNRDLGVLHITDDRLTYAQYQAKVNSRGNWSGGTWKWSHAKEL